MKFRVNKLKVKVKTEKQLNELVTCAECGARIKYKDSYSYIDGNNWAITERSKPHCINCKHLK